ncbi:MAG TPA: GntR family transcriptional regulator [Burkholderiales bacterium]|jgi:DNA-binding GntR family transcriptional regulator
MDNAPTLTSSIYERLRNDILMGHWEPGMKLGIEALREHYGTGATPLREALNRLVAESWVQHLDQRGFAVAAVSVVAFRELAETRIWVETLALTQAMQRHSPEWEERVVLALHRLSKTARSLSPDHYEENPAWEKAHRAFHFSLIENCGSRWLLAFCEQLHDQAYRYRQLAVKKAYLERDELAEHRAVVDAVARGDVAAATQALTAHYSRTTDFILEDTPPGKPA